jgi:hypothetical protein
MRPKQPKEEVKQIEPIHVEPVSLITFLKNEILCWKLYIFIAVVAIGLISGLTK